MQALQEGLARALQSQAALQAHLSQKEEDLTAQQQTIDGLWKAVDEAQVEKVIANSLITPVIFSLSCFKMQTLSR